MTRQTTSKTTITVFIIAIILIFAVGFSFHNLDRYKLTNNQLVVSNHPGYLVSYTLYGIDILLIVLVVWMMYRKVKPWK